MDPIMQSIASALPQKDVAPVQPAAPVAVAPVTPEVTPVAPVPPVAPVVPAEPAVITSPVEPEVPTPPVVDPEAIAAAPAVTLAADEPKPWYEDSAAPVVTDSGAKPINETIDPIYQDQEVLLFVEAKKAGKTLLDFVSDFQVVDYSKYSDAEIVDTALKEMFPDQENFEQAKATFEGYDIFQQKQKISEFRNMFNSRVQEKQKLLTEPLARQQAHAQEIATKFTTELESNIQELTGKDYKGFTITADIAQDVKKYVAEGFSLFKPDGTADVNKMIDFALWEKYGHQIVKANVHRAKNEGRKEVLEQVTNPSPLPSNSAPVNTGAGDIKSALDYFANKK